MISFFYINCPTAQPALITFFRLQKLLAETLGKEVVLLTLTADPENDDLQRIKEYATKFNPGKGWLFITGKPENMNALSLKLGNVKTGHWMRLLETAPVQALAEGVSSLSEK